jgi:tetratricopeptide (TPR) repeat protein
MNSQETLPSIAPPVTTGVRRRPFRLVLIALAVVLLGGGGYHLWRKYTTPEPPTVDLTGLDQEIIDAVEGARKQVREYPRTAGTWGQLGAVLRAHGFDIESNFCFAQAERLNPKDYRWPYLIALEQLGHDPDAALPRLRRAVELCGHEPAPRLLLGEVLLDRREMDEAERLFRAILEEESDNARAHLGLGRIALERQDVDDALKHLRLAAVRAPQARRAHAVLAQAHRLARDEEAAEEQLRLLAGLAEDWTWPDPALDFVHSTWTGLRARIATINGFEKRGRREEAVLLAQQTVERYPDSAHARLIFGGMLNRANNSVAAEPVLREAIRLDPRRTKAHFELGYAQQAQGKLRDAAASYRRALELQPDLALAHYNLALCLTNLQEFADAEKEYRAAIHYRPEYVDAFMGLAILLSRQNRSADARRYLQEAVRAAPNDPRPRQLFKKMFNEEVKPAPALPDERR